jgi:hypothetical protein
MLLRSRENRESQRLWISAAMTFGQVKVFDPIRQLLAICLAASVFMLTYGVAGLILSGADGGVDRFFGVKYYLCARWAGRVTVLGRTSLGSRSNGCISVSIFTSSAMPISIGIASHGKVSTFEKPTILTRIVLLRLLLIAIFSLFLLQCSGNSTAENADQRGNTEQLYTKNHFSILDAIPPQILGIENLRVFPGDSEPIYSMRIIPQQTYGKDGEPYLGRIMGSIVDDNDRVIITDMRPSEYSHRVHIFNDDGSYYSQLGGPGRGPGEYGMVSATQNRASKISLIDFTNMRLNEYSSEDYSLIRTTPLEQWRKGDKYEYVEPRNDGNYLVTYSDSRSKIGRIESNIFLMDSNGNQVDFEPFVFPDGYRVGVGEVIRPTMPISFMGRTTTTLSEKDDLYSAWTPEFLIKRYDAKGVYQSAIYYPIQGIPFDLNHHTPYSRFEPSVQVIRNATPTMDEPLPKTYPVVEGLMVDDENRIWVSVPMDTNRDMLDWWILSESGELLARLQRQRELRFVVKNGHLYGKEVDEKTRVEFVMKYRIELTEN